MRLTPRVRLQTFPASRLEENTFQQLCDLRRSLIHLQPGVEPDADYRAFRRFFEGERAHVTVMRSTTGQLEGFLGWHVRSLQTPQGRVGVLDSDYYFIKPELRGHSALASVALGCYLKAARLSRSHRVVMVGHGYPASVLSGLRFAWRLRFLQDPDLLSWEREALMHFTTHYCLSSFDPITQCVRMRTLPAEGRREPRTRAAKAAFSRFEQYNPSWLEGVGLLYILHWTPSSILRGAVGRRTG